MKKYEFTGETMEFEGHTLKRIRYVRQLKFVKKGSLGAWIESEQNLSHEGECRILQNAKVFGNARVMENALICSNAIVKDNAQVLSNSYIYGNAIVGADSIISGQTQIYGESKVFFYAKGLDEEYGQHNISGNSRIMDCIIESTGTIYNCRIFRQELYGFLERKI